MNTNFDVIEIPKCEGLTHKFVLKHVKPTDSWWLQEKIDGHRRVLFKDDNGNFHAYGPRFSTVTNRREDVIHKLGGRVRGYLNSMPNNTALDGEVHCPGIASTSVPTLMKDDSAELDFLCFGVMYFAGTKICGDVEYQKALVKSVPWVNQAQLPGIALRENFNDVYARYSAAAAERGLEGWVLKKSYLDKMAKLKLRKTWDLIVIGTTAADFGVTGKFQGLIGSLVCGAHENGKLIEVCTCSGMDDATRRAFTENPPIGQVIEVEGQMIAAKGRIRHPQFKRLRPDKGPADCIWPQVG